MPSRFQLKGPSLAALKWQLLTEYGQRARIVRAERIQVGGLFGMGASTSYEVTVEVDGVASQRALASRSAATPPAGKGQAGTGQPASGRRRATAGSWPGLTALLAEADAADGPGAPSRPDSVAASPATVVATPAEPSRPSPAAQEPAQSAFDVVLAKLAQEEIEASEPSEGENNVQPSQRAGDLILLIGLRGEPLGVAQTMARELNRGNGAEVRTAGEYRIEGVEHLLIDSPGVAKAQALAAVAGRPLLIAFSIGERTSSKPDILASVKADQVWLVVDAAHKPEDTDAWVRQACWFTNPHALAVVGVKDTATPESVNDLGIPIGWLDGQQAATTMVGTL